jgi:hypothetical protein
MIDLHCLDISNSRQFSQSKVLKKSRRLHLLIDVTLQLFRSLCRWSQRIKRLDAPFQLPNQEIDCIRSVPGAYDIHSWKFTVFELFPTLNMMHVIRLMHQILHQYTAWIKMVSPNRLHSFQSLCLLDFRFSTHEEIPCPIFITLHQK